jgi:aspartyl/asparaginyl-tRNA synthetase
MQKLSTTPKKTDLNSEKQRLDKSLQMQPKVATLQKILQFASVYRAEPVNENQYVEWYLN